tara:strand:- start:317 stop:481 length:165 start_codon:yes stop_codon:yes gene_type:complete
MVKILLGIVLFFVFIFFGISLWEKLDKIEKKNFKVAWLALFSLGLLIIGYLLYN